MNKKGFFWILFFIFIVPLVSADYCYQETANVSTSCGGLSSGLYDSFISGTYSFTGSGSCIGTMVDGNQATGCVPVINSSVILYTNYSIPSLANLNSYWVVSSALSSSFDTNVSLNASFPLSCFSTNVLQLQVNSTSLGESVNPRNVFIASCYNGTNWVGNFSSYNSNSWGIYILDESIYWNFDSSGGSPLLSSFQVVQPSLVQVRDAILGGASIKVVLTLWNPSVYPQLSSKVHATLKSHTITNLFRNLFQLFLLMIQYILREPASLVPAGGLV